MAFAKVEETPDPDLEGATVILAPSDGFVSGPPDFIDVDGSYSAADGGEKYSYWRVYPDGDISESLGKETDTVRRQWSNFILALRGLKHIITSPEIRSAMRVLVDGAPKGVDLGDGSHFSIAVKDLIVVRQVLEALAARSGGRLEHIEIDPDRHDWTRLVQEFPQLTEIAEREWKYEVFSHEPLTWQELRAEWSDYALATTVVDGYWLMVGVLGIVHWDHPASRRSGAFVIDEGDPVAVAYRERNRG